MIQRLLAIGLAVAGALAGLTLAGDRLAAAPQPPLTVLYDHFTGFGTQSAPSTVSASPDLTDYTANVFTVPASQVWRIEQVEAQLLLLNRPNGTVGAGVQVIVWTNANGVPSTVVFQETVAPASGQHDPHLILPTGQTPPLTSGVYWVAIQAILNAGPGGNWNWLNSTTSTASPALYINPGGGGGTGCAAHWGVRYACLNQDPAQPEQVFRLDGTLREGGPPSTPTPRPPTPTRTPTPVPGPFMPGTFVVPTHTPTRTPTPTPDGPTRTPTPVPVHFTPGTFVVPTHTPTPLPTQTPG